MKEFENTLCKHLEGLIDFYKNPLSEEGIKEVYLRYITFFNNITYEQWLHVRRIESTFPINIKEVFFEVIMKLDIGADIYRNTNSRLFFIVTDMILWFQSYKAALNWSDAVFMKIDYKKKATSIFIRIN